MVVGETIGSVIKVGTITDPAVVVTRLAATSTRGTMGMDVIVDSMMATEAGIGPVRQVTPVTTRTAIDEEALALMGGQERRVNSIFLEDTVPIFQMFKLSSSQISTRIS